MIPIFETWNLYHPDNRKKLIQGMSYEGNLCIRLFSLWFEFMKNVPSLDSDWKKFQFPYKSVIHLIVHIPWKGLSKNLFFFGENASWSKERHIFNEKLCWQWKETHSEIPIVATGNFSLLESGNVPESVIKLRLTIQDSRCDDSWCCSRDARLNLCFPYSCNAITDFRRRPWPEAKQNPGIVVW